MSQISKLEESILSQCEPLKNQSEQLVKELTLDNEKAMKEKTDLHVFLKEASAPLTTLESDLAILADKEASLKEIQEELNTLEEDLSAKENAIKEKLTETEKTFKYTIENTTRLTTQELVETYTDIIVKMRNMNVLGQASQTQIKCDQRRQLQDTVMEFETRINKKKNNIAKLENELNECQSYQIPSSVRTTFKKNMAIDYQFQKNELIKLKLAVHKLGGRIE